MLNKHFSIASFLLLFMVSNVTLSDINSGEHSRKSVVGEEEQEGNHLGVNTSENECRTKGGWFVSEDDVSSEEALDVCAESGGELAAVTSTNFNNIISLLIRCKGPGTRGWIKSWQGTDYGSDCLTIFAGQAVPGGGVDTNCLGDSIPAICTVKKESKKSLSSSTTPTVSAAKDINDGEPTVSAEDQYHAQSSSISVDSESLYPFLSTVRHPRKQRFQSIH